MAPKHIVIQDNNDKNNGRDLYNSYIIIKIFRVSREKNIRCVGTFYTLCCTLLWYKNI